MRVVVASRADPPVPDDVPADHPLRDPAIRVPLKPSQYAHDLRGLMDRELAALLADSAHGLDLLGLVIAAGGGLSAPDLAELIGCRPWEVGVYLKTVAGRSFTSRPSYYRPATASAIYLLAHEELEVIAREQIGKAGVGEYYGRLHTWAEDYHTRHWPDDTPEYLLSGYHNILLRTEDLPRLVMYATDPARHKRLRILAGGDSAALTEIVKTMDLCGIAEAPDLDAMARLAVHRSVLLDRNERMPFGAAEVWAALGETTRAESMARSRNSSTQAEMLVSIAKTAAESGDTGYTYSLVEEAETIIAASNPFTREAVSSRIAEVLVIVGDLDRAEAMARSITEPMVQWRLTATAQRLATTGDVNQAARFTDTISDPGYRAHALAAVARALVVAGDLDRAKTVAYQVENLADSMKDAWNQYQAYALVAVVQAFVAVGDPDRAKAVTCRLKNLANSTKRDDDRALLLVEVVQALIAMSDVDQAEAIAESSVARSSDAWRSRMLLALVEAAVAGGDNERADAIIQSITDGNCQRQAVAAIAKEATTADDFDRAETLALSITDQRRRDEAMVSVAIAAIKKGDTARARAIVERLEANPSSTATRDTLTGVLALARALIIVGDAGRARRVLARAERLAGDMTTERSTFPKGCAEIVDAAVAAGDLNYADAAVRLLADNQLMLRPAVMLVVKAAAAAGDFNQAESLCQLISNDRDRVRAVAVVRDLAVAIGDLDRAEAMARSLSDNYERTDALLAVGKAAAGAGDADRAETVALGNIAAYRWGEAMVALVEAAVVGGHPTAARTIVDRAEARIRTVHATGEHLAAARTVAERVEAQMHAMRAELDRERDLLAVAEAAAIVGDLERAESLADSITCHLLRVEALATVAKTAAKTGHQARALALAKRAIRLFYVPRLHDDAVNDHWLIPLVSAVAATGELDQAAALARTVTDKHDQSRAFFAVVKAAVSAGDLRRAAALVHTMDDTMDKHDALALVTEAAVAAGDFDQAEAVVRRDPFVRDTGWALIPVAKAAAEAGDLDQAVRLAHFTPDDRKLEIFMALNAAVAVTGDFDRAVALAGTIRLPDQVRALVSLAKAASRSGHATRAEAITEHAEQLTNSIGNKHLQAIAFADLATVATPARARRFLAKTFSLSRWDVALDALAQLDHATVLNAMTDEYLGTFVGSTLAT
jgi:tetratricopeptide (TPR) repeat protein